MSQSAIPKGSLVLVTGANGFVGSHVADQILAAGFRVRGTVRDQSKADLLTEVFDKRHGKGKFEAVLVSDMAAKDAFDEAMKDCSGVAHVASVLSFDADPNKVIPPTIDGAVNALRSAAKHPSVKRVVLTSSSTSAVLPKPNVKFHFDSSTWNKEAKDIAWAPPPYNQDRAFPVYASSKTEAEEACWKFMKEEKPGFVFNAVLPNFNIGEIFHPKMPGGATGSMIRGAWQGDEKTIETLREFPPQWFINAGDTGRLHLAGIMEEDVKNERLMGFASPYNFNDIIDCMQQIDPQKSLPKKIENPEKDLSTVDTKRSEELLKRQGRSGWVNLQDSIKENVMGA